VNLQSLLLSSDDKTTRTLRRVLGELEIGVEHCSDADSAICKLTRRRFEAVIVDCDDDAAAHMITSVRSAPGNKHAVVAATVGSRAAAQMGFGKEADFLLYRPVSLAQARRCFGAARYLMKCEHRRNARVMVQFPLAFLSGKRECGAVTTDISENGIAVRLPLRLKKNSFTRVRFTLPGTDHVIECTTEVAWENARSEAGFRFMDLSREDREKLKAWLNPYCFDFQRSSPLIPGNPAQAVQLGWGAATE
jgi:ActR/RegA family two-component response regulator